MENIKFDLRDISIIPAIESTINSRSECKTTYSDGFLPLMASPMDTVVCDKNIQKYIDEQIIPCMPRGSKVPLYSSNYENRKNYFQSFGLYEIEYQLNSKEKTLFDFSTYPNILIDIANGHMSKLLSVVREIKARFPNINLMVGNVAHPLTYKNLAMAGVDYVRCSIGTGCFLPGQRVKLDDNKEKNIEELQPGDKVLTHKNRYEKIKNKFEYYIEEEIYNVNNIKCTKTHKFYVIEKHHENIVNDENLEQYAKWISADELDKEKHLLIEY
jgi:hypothetical protein